MTSGFEQWWIVSHTLERLVTNTVSTDSIDIIERTSSLQKQNQHASS